VQVRQGQERLGGDLPLGDHHREFAAAARDDLTGDEDMVAEVDEFFPEGEGVLAHRGKRDHGLDAAAVARLQRGEAELAGVAEVHDAAGDADHVARDIVCHELGVLRANGRDRGGHGDTHRVGLGSGGDQSLPLGEPYRLLLGDLGNAAELAFCLADTGCLAGGAGVLAHTGVDLLVRLEFTGTDYAR
jgi:hypothetical protein